MSKRHKDALYIVDPGACNPSGIANSIAEACRESRAESGDPRHDPAIKLMTYQLASVMGMEPMSSIGLDDYSSWVSQCREGCRE